MNKENNININFTSIVDYIRDKDFLIEDLRFKLDKYKTTIDKIKEILKETIDDEFYINLTNKEKALYKIHELLEEIE